MKYLPPWIVSMVSAQLSGLVAQGASREVILARARIGNVWILLAESINWNV